MSEGLIARLTDGILDAVSGAELAAAQELRETGVTLYAIGVDMDVNTLIEMAGGRGRCGAVPAGAARQHRSGHL